MAIDPLAHPICLAIPERLTAVRSWHEHIPFAMLLVDWLRPSLLVELGTHAGDSYCAFCQAVKELNLDTRCYAVDTWQGDAHSGFYQASVLDDLRAHHDPLYGSFSSLIQSTFDEAAQHFTDGTINLLHIDGYHTYEAVKHDFELWLPKMSADGVVLFHDTNVRERNFGISKFWDEIKQRYPHFEFLHGHGLGVLAVGRVQSPQVQALLSAQPEMAVQIRQLFYQLGQRLALQDDVAVLQQKIATLQGEVERLQQQLAARTAEAQTFAKREAERAYNPLQLFWGGASDFTEALSLEEPLLANEQIAEYTLRLPPEAEAPLRLDPSNRPAYIEIHRIELYAESDDAALEPELLARWSAAEDFAGLVGVSGLVRLAGREVYRCVAVDDDPQILLGGVPARRDLRVWFLRVRLRISEHFQTLMADEISRLESAQENQQKQLTARETELAETLQGLQNLQSQWAAERERFADRIKGDEQTIQSQSSELIAARDQIASLGAQVTQQQTDLKALQNKFAAQHRQFSRQIEEQQSAQQALIAALQEKTTAEQRLLGDLTNQEQTLGALRQQISEQREQFSEQREQFSHRLISEIQQREHTERELQAKEQQLQRILHSLGWRLLSRYGRFKYGVLLPLYHQMRVTLEILSQRKVHLTPEPTHELHRIEDSEIWESTGRDPQFNLSGVIPSGWAEVTLDLDPQTPVTGRARLYIDRGAGYNEKDSYDLGEAGGERKCVVRFGPEVVGLRLDPFESVGRFRIHTLTLKAVGARHVTSASDHRPGGGFAVKRFIQFAQARAVSFRQKHGHAPRLTELPAAVRRTLRAWNQQRALLEAISRPSALTPQPQLPPNPQVLPPALEPYEAWLEVNEWNERREHLLKERLSAIAEPPLLSVVMPVYNPPPEFLDQAIASIARQVYGHWELCIADDASTDPAIREMLQNWMAREPRLRVVFRETNGHISRATNSAAEIARGDYLVLMDQDDELTPDALGEVALYLAAHPETDVLYSDDDKINTEGQRFAPQFKPDWSPELLLSYMYFSHLFVMRRQVFNHIGGLRAGYEGSQDYDLALRITETTDRIAHLPQVLYHWRVLPGSTAASGDAKPESFAAGRRAVQDALERRAVQAKALQPDWAVQAACGIFTQAFPDDGPRVAIIIPTKNNLAVLKTCVESLAKTTYRNYEVVIIDNESDEAETLAYLRQSPHKVLRIANPNGRFSFAAINNAAVEQAEADYILFLNNDTEVVAPRWLSQMVGYLGLSDVGAVGARLLFPDGRLQHAGIVHGYYNGMAGPAFKLLPADNHGYLSYTMVTRNYSAVTAACLLTRRDLFLSLGGFDEERFAVAYNDVDYCYRLRAAGYRIAYCPTAELIHHEGYSRGFKDNPAEAAAFRKKYGAWRDPFYNPNLSLADERFAIDARTLAPASIKPIRALMCAFNLNWEGAPYSQFELTARLKESGIIEPIVYCPQDGPLRAAYEERGIQVEVFAHPLAGVHELAAYEQAIANFAKKIDEWNIELVYGNTRQTFYAIDAAKRLNRPSIWNPRESEPWETYFDYLGAEIAARAQSCFSYPYKVIFVSDATRASCAPLNAHHNFITIHNGLERQRFTDQLKAWPRPAARHRLGIAPDETAILLLGTVCERKGQVDLVEAVARLTAASVNQLKCFIVGDRASAYSDRLHAAWHALPAESRACIKIIEETSDTALYYAAADVFVCSSRVESFPRVILEAMAAGLPIITTPVFGIAEQVQENINALIYQPGDTQTLATHLERFLREPELRKKFAANSAFVLDTLTDFEAMVSAYGEVFREAWLSGRSR